MQPILAIELQRYIKEVKDNDLKYLTMEVSSQAYKKQRSSNVELKESTSAGSDPTESEDPTEGETSTERETATESETSTEGTEPSENEEPSSGAEPQDSPSEI